MRPSGFSSVIESVDRAFGVDMKRTVDVDSCGLRAVCIALPMENGEIDVAAIGRAASAALRIVVVCGMTNEWVRCTNVAPMEMAAKTEEKIVGERIAILLCWRLIVGRRRSLVEGCNEKRWQSCCIGVD